MEAANMNPLHTKRKPRLSIGCRDQKVDPRVRGNMFDASYRKEPID